MWTWCLWTPPRGRGYIGANPDKLKIVGDAIKSEDFGFIFQKGSDLVAPFNAAIESMKQDGFTSYLDNKWFFLTDPNGKDVYDSLPELGGPLRRRRRCQ